MEAGAFMESSGFPVIQPFACLFLIFPASIMYRTLMYGTGVFFVFRKFFQNMWNEHSLLVKSPKLPVGLSFGRCRPGLTGIFRRYPLFSERSRQKKPRNVRSPLTGVTSDSWDTPAGHRIYDACRGSSVSWVCRGSGASIVSSTSC